MTKKTYTVITGTGSHVPSKVVKNEDFLSHKFYQPGKFIPFENPVEEIIQKFEEITNINERRYIEDDQTNSDIATASALEAIADAGIDKETLDFIIVGHNFGDIQKGSTKIDTLPSVANKVKAKLKIKNAECFCHDLISGCPSWTQAMITADAYIRCGDFKRGLVIGSDVLSRVNDPHDRDSMIFADGSAAVVVEGVESRKPVGIISHASRSDSDGMIEHLYMGPSWNEEYDQSELTLKMAGHKIYVYALSNVPRVVKQSIDKAGLDLSDIKKVFIHQANEKMDWAILERLFKLYKVKEIPEGIMPMTIRELGNSSAATVPTLLDLVLKGKKPGHKVESGEHIILTSVGAGMNINSIVYKMP